MEVLEKKDYILIFIKGSQYDSTEKIAAYFEGKYSKIKESNPMELYLDGLHKAFQFFEKHLKEEHHEEMRNYYLSKGFEPTEEHERPDINDNWLPASSIHHEFTGHYNYQMIQRIKEGLDKFQNDLNKEQAKTVSSQNTEKDEYSIRWNDSVNNFNDMDLEKVEEFFMQFSERNCKNGEPFLNEDEVIKFIYRAFCNVDGISELSFNTLGARATIINLFHIYFTICRNTIEPDAQCQDKYINLLTANFIGWDYDKVRNNFSKYSSYKWRITKPGQLGL